LGSSVVEGASEVTAEGRAKGTSTGLIVGISVAAVVIVTGGAVEVFFLRKNKETDRGQIRNDK
jgi:hypothetical protein